MQISKRYNKRAKRHTYSVRVYNRVTDQKENVGTFNTLEEAKKEGTKRERELHLGENQPIRQIGWNALVDEWMSPLTHLRERTRHDYKYSTQHLRDAWGDRWASSIDRRDLEKVIGELVQAGLSAWYVRKIKARAAQIMRYAEDVGYVRKSPFEGKLRNLPKEPRRNFEPLTAAQLQRLFDELPEYWRPSVLMALGCGLRFSEVFGLRQQDIDMGTGRVYVRKQLSLNGELVDPKTENAIRMVPMPSFVATALTEHLKVVPENDLDLVFPTENGFPVRGSNFRRRVWNPAVERAELSAGLRMHDLRAQFATVLVSRGRSMPYFQSVMGHSSASTTLKWYVGYLKDEEDQGARDLDEFLGREGAA